MDWGSAGIGLVGALIGGGATLVAADRTFRQRARDDAQRAAVAHDTWRRALHQECIANIRLDLEQPRGLWSFQMRVLDEVAMHPDFFTEEELYRVRLIRLADTELEERLAVLRPRRLGQGLGADDFERLKSLRQKVIGEVNVLESTLRRVAP